MEDKKQLTKQLLDKLYRKENFTGKIIGMFIYGSHLFGVSTPKSDLDVKVIYMPSYGDVLLGKVKKNITISTNKDKNNQDDIDIECFSIHEFFRLALSGQTMVFDLLNVTEECTMIKHDIWDQIVDNKNLFLSRNMSAFMGYCIGQMRKYSDKGKRLAVLKKLVSVLPEDGDLRLRDTWGSLYVDDEFIKKEFDKNMKPPQKVYIVLGKKFHEGVTVEYLKTSLQKSIGEYGERARLSEKANGADYKAMSHAIRIADELIEIFKTGEIKFPLANSEFILEVKQGKHSVDKVQETIERQMVIIKKLESKSDYPDKPDQEKVERLLLMILRNFYDTSPVFKKFIPNGELNRREKMRDGLADSL